MPFKFGRGFGRGRGQKGGGRGMGRGRMRMPQARHVQIPENCICPQCGTTIPHHRGMPCFQTACPNCGSFMTRQFNVPGEQAPAQQASSSQKPVVDQDACTGCQKCIPVCPEQAIEMRHDKAFILPQKCTNCRVCIPVCHFSAIN